jgi:hypothetical protein
MASRAGHETGRMVLPQLYFRSTLRGFSYPASSPSIIHESASHHSKAVTEFAVATLVELLFVRASPF